MSNTSKVKETSKIRVPTTAEDAAIIAAAKNDPDARPLTRAQLAKMQPMKAHRGRPKSANPKVLLSVRYSPEVVEYFRGLGDGWQSQMDSVLLKHVKRANQR